MHDSANNGQKNKRNVQHTHTGKSEDSPPARLSLDPIFATQRPMYFYAAIGLLNVGAHAALRMLGFKKLPQYDTATQAQFIYYRPKESSGSSTNSNTNGSGATSSSSSSSPLPLVFIHGIGIGFAHYLGLIASFPREVDVFLVEWPHVAMQMSCNGPTTAESVRTMRAVLADHGHSEACFAAHSLGKYVMQVVCISCLFISVVFTFCG